MKTSFNRSVLIIVFACLICCGLEKKSFAILKEGTLIGYCCGSSSLIVAGDIAVKDESGTTLISTTITKNIQCDPLTGTFLIKLPPGLYILYSIDSNKFVAEGLRFEILPGKTHYIGSIYPQWRTAEFSRKFTKKELRDTVFVGTYCYGLEGPKNEVALIKEPLAVFFINNFEADMKKIQLKYPNASISKKDVVNLLKAKFTAIFKVVTMNGLQK